MGERKETYVSSCEELSWAWRERERAELPGVSSWLKQQTKNKRIRSLITYWEGVKQESKTQSSKSSCSIFAHGKAPRWRVSWINTDIEVVILYFESVLSKRLQQFYGLWAWGGEGKGQEWKNTGFSVRVGKCVPKVSPSSPLKGPEDTMFKASDKRPRNAGAWTRNVNMQRQWLARGACIIDCNSFQRLQCTDCALSLVWGQRPFPKSPAR